MEITKDVLVNRTRICDRLKEAGIIVDKVDFIIQPDKFMIRLVTSIRPQKEIDYFAFCVFEKEDPDCSSVFYLDFDWDRFGYRLKNSPYLTAPQPMTIERWIYEDPNNVGSLGIDVYCKEDQ